LPVDCESARRQSGALARVMPRTDARPDNAVRKSA
jgi:hypothetical protein